MAPESFGLKWAVCRRRSAQILPYEPSDGSNRTGSWDLCSPLQSGLCSGSYGRTRSSDGQTRNRQAPESPSLWRKRFRSHIMTAADARFLRLMMFSGATNSCFRRRGCETARRSCLEPERGSRTEKQAESQVIMRQAVRSPCLQNRQRLCVSVAAAKRKHYCPEIGIKRLPARQGRSVPDWSLCLTSKR